MFSAGSGNTVIKSKLISRRMFLLSVGKAIVLVGVLGRLISLQINESSNYKTLSDKNRFREWKLAPERGAIKDFFDTKIASTEPLYQLHLVPENAKDLDNLFVRLKAILNITDRKVSYLKRVIKKPKVHFIDSGLASFLLNVDIKASLEGKNEHLGNLVETFVYSELIKAKTYAMKNAELFYYKTSDKKEIG